VLDIPTDFCIMNLYFDKGENEMTTLNETQDRVIYNCHELLDLLDTLKDVSIIVVVKSA
jgi:hypothetical protein